MLLAQAVLAALSTVFLKYWSKLCTAFWAVRPGAVSHSCAIPLSATSSSSWVSSPATCNCSGTGPELALQGHAVHALPLTLAQACKTCYRLFHLPACWQLPRGTLTWADSHLETCAKVLLACSACWTQCGLQACGIMTAREAAQLAKVPGEGHLAA